MHHLARQCLRTNFIAFQILLNNGISNINQIELPQIIANSKEEIEYNSEFKLEDYYEVKNNISSEINIGVAGTVYTSESGDYLITLTATDGQGNMSIKNILFTVLPKVEEKTEDKSKTVQIHTSNKVTIYDEKSASNTSVQTYTPSNQQETNQEQSSSSTTYFEQDESNSNSSFYDSIDACRASHSSGQCIPVVGDGSGYVWQP